MSGRSGAALGWSVGVGLLGAIALGAYGVALSVLLSVVGDIASQFFLGTDQESDQGGGLAVTGAAVAVCLAISTWGGWVISAAPDGLTPRWLAGLATGLIGVGAGAVVLSVGLG